MDQLWECSLYYMAWPKISVKRQNHKLSIIFITNEQRKIIYYMSHIYKTYK